MPFLLPSLPAVITLSLSVLVASAPSGISQTRMELPGWGPFKFGTKRDEILSRMGDRVMEDRSGSWLRYSALIKDNLFNAHLYFDRDTKLSEIVLSTGGIADLRRPECVAKRNALDGMLAETYGRPASTAINAEKMPGGDPDLFHQLTTWPFQDGGSVVTSIVILGPSRTDRPFECSINVKYTAPTMPRRTIEKF